MSDTDADVTRHQEHVREMVVRGGPLDTTGPNATTANPEWFIGGDVDAATPSRRRLHRQLIDEHRARQPGAQAGHRALVMAGPPGAGKSRMRQQLLDDESAWLRIDPDEFKEALLRQAIADGSYDSFIKPAAIAAAEQAGDPFYPLELSSLVHVESSYLAMRAREEAMREGLNVIIDSVQAWPEAAERLGRDLTAAGYTIDVVDVEVPFEVSEARIRGRWRHDYVQALENGDAHHLGGRWVPSEYARTVFAGDDGRARSQESAARLAATTPTVMTYRRYWTPTNDADPILEVDQARTTPGGRLMPGVVVRATTASSGNSGTPQPQAGRRIDPPPGQSLDGPHLEA